MTQLTITDALILARPGAEQASRRHDVFVTDGRIEAVLPAGERAGVGEMIDGAGCLLTPGLINGHHHSHEHYHKGRYDRVPLELWMNYVRPLKPIPVTPRQVYLRTLIGAIQALRSGTTTLVDDLNVGSELDPDLVDAALQAYRDIGIRAMVGLTLFDKPFFRALPFVDEEFPQDLLARLDASKPPPATDILDVVKKLAIDHHPGSDRVSVLLAPSAPQRCTDDFLRLVRATADDMDLPIIIHVHETRVQAVMGQLFYEKSMFAHLADLGFLKPKTQLIHAVWATPDDIKLIADHGASVQHNPNSNMKLGSGLMPMRAYLDAGVNVSLGTDGCGSVETLDMLRTVSATALVHKLRGDDYTRWIGAEEAWHAATLGGATALGASGRLGEVTVGAAADLCLFRLNTAAFTPLNNPLRQLVYAETGSGLETVIIDGKAVMQRGQLTRIDESAILSEAVAAHGELEPAISDAERTVDEMMPAYRRIVERCRWHEVSAGTIAARWP